MDSPKPNDGVPATMDWLNYHHLHYFWVTAREGSVTGAARRLHLSPSTVSAQIRTLESALGHPLFARRGRGLTLTEPGRVTLDYCDEIFSLGQELQDAMRSASPLARTPRLRVGVANILPKLVAYRLLAPVLHMPRPVRLICREDNADKLVADLAVHHLDLVIADAPVALEHDLHVRSRVLGECGLVILAAPALADRYTADFPRSLDGAPFLLPGTDTTMRGLLDSWFEQEGIHPHIVAEFGESALLKAFGAEGAGLYPVPAVVEAEIAEQYGVRRVGALPLLRERFFAITMAHREDNPVIRHVLASAGGLLEKAAATP